MTNGFNKQCTDIAKGLAIILMICHHVFTKNQSLESIAYIRYWNQVLPVEYMVGHYGKICVAMFAFLSGVGIYYSTRNATIDIQKVALSKIIAFYKLYWKYTILFMLVMTFRLKESVYTFLVNALAIDSTWFGAWWYASPYIMLLFFLPIYYLWIKRVKASLSLDFVEVFICWTFTTYVYPVLMQSELMRAYSCNNRFWWIFYQMLQLTPTFLLGIIFAKYDLYSKFQELFKYKALLYMCAITMVVGAFIFRSHYGDVTEEQLPEFMYALFIIVGFVTLIKDTYRIKKIFIFFGKNSMKLWLVHAGVIALMPFWTNVFLIRYIPKYQLIYFIVIIIVSLLVIILIDKVYEMGEGVINRIMARKKV